MIFAIFSRQDLLQLALDLDAPVPRAYGSIEQDANGKLYTTRAQRTGCSIIIEDGCVSSIPEKETPSSNTWTTGVF